jgi:hypothetical protein
MPETRPKVINGISFDISQPYEAGHVLTEIEAKVLNQTRSENVGNNVRQRIKDMQEGGTDAFPEPQSEDAIRAYVADFDANYEFRTASEGAGKSRDPYEVEARKLARDLLKEHLAGSGRKTNVTPEGMTDDEWKDKVDTEIDRIASLPNVLAAAKKTVDAKRKQSASLLESLGSVEV